MRNFLLGLIIAVTALFAGDSIAEEKETYFVVKLTGFDKISSIEMFNNTDIAELNKKIVLEAKVLPQAFKEAILEWSKTAKKEKRSAVFPLSSPPAPRTLRILSQSTDSEKAGKALDKFAKKNDEDVLKAQKTVADKKAKQTEAARKKGDEKEALQALALDLLITKIDELVLKEAEKSGAATVL